MPEKNSDNIAAFIYVTAVVAAGLAAALVYFVRQ